MLLFLWITNNSQKNNTGEMLVCIKGVKDSLALRKWEKG